MAQIGSSTKSLPVSADEEHVSASPDPVTPLEAMPVPVAVAPVSQGGATVGRQVEDRDGHGACKVTPRRARQHSRWDTGVRDMARSLRGTSDAPLPAPAMRLSGGGPLDREVESVSAADFIPLFASPGASPLDPSAACDAETIRLERRANRPPRNFSSPKLGPYFGRRRPPPKTTPKRKMPGTSPAMCGGRRNERASRNFSVASINFRGWETAPSTRNHRTPAEAVGDVDAYIPGAGRDITAAILAGTGNNPLAGADLVALSETHLLGNQRVEGVQGYQWFGMNAQAHAAPTLLRGSCGVGFLVKNSIAPFAEFLAVASSERTAWVRLQTPPAMDKHAKHQNGGPTPAPGLLFVASVYAPQSNSKEANAFWDKLALQVVEFQRRGRVILAGDFNSHTALKLGPNGDPRSRKGGDICANGKCLVRLCRDAGLTALNTLASAKGTMTWRRRVGTGDDNAVPSAIGPVDEGSVGATRATATDSPKEVSQIDYIISSDDLVPALLNCETQFIDAAQIIPLCERSSTYRLRALVRFGKRTTAGAGSSKRKALTLTGDLTRQQAKRQWRSSRETLGVPGTPPRHLLRAKEALRLLSSLNEPGRRWIR